MLILTEKDMRDIFLYTSLVFTEGSAYHISKETFVTISRLLAPHMLVFAALDLNSLTHCCIHV